MLKQKKNLKLKIKTFLTGKYVFITSFKKLLEYKNLCIKNKILLKKKILKKVYLTKNSNSFFKASSGLVNLYSSNYKKYENFFLKKQQPIILYVISIRLGVNNIFCTLAKKEKNSLKLILAKSAGQYNLKISKKTAKFNQILIVKKFLKDIRKVIKKKKFQFSLYLKLFLPLKIRQKIINFIFNIYKRQAKTILFSVLEKKAFNGCRPKKKKRKKRKGLRIFK